MKEKKVVTEEERLNYWAKKAESLHWFKKWETLLEWKVPYAKWFIGGKINVCYNCLDRHQDTATFKKTALLWENENGDSLSLTYEELYTRVNKFSNILKSLGIKKGDAVGIYLPMIPEAIIAMLSCARIGAIHTVIFAGFSANALKERLLDADAKLLITADGGFRKGEIIPLKIAADEALKECPSVKKTLVIRHTNSPIPIIQDRDVLYENIIENVSDFCPCEEMDSEDPLFILYTSGTTAKPKGILHTTAGYLLGATTTTAQVFDIKDSDTYFCTADVGWITGHSYVAYGPLSNGMSQLIYEGSFDFPAKDQIWKLIEKYGITILYTAPTAIRTFMKWGESFLENYDLSSLRILGSVGEPINKEAWEWYFTHVGKKNCPIVDTWWQTETGSIMISPLPGITPLKPGSATFPLPGIEASILNDEGKSCTSGYLSLKAPWPSMLRGIYKDNKRFEETYWSKWKNSSYYTGDAAVIDEEGYYWLMGRVDDVINVSGHRLGTMEIESAIASHESVAEAAAVATQHDIKGQAIVTFVVLKDMTKNHNDLSEILKKHVSSVIGAIARPERVIFINDLPKTRSGKVMRRLLRDIAEGRILGDTMTLSDPKVMQDIKTKYQEDDSTQP